MYNKKHINRFKLKANKQTKHSVPWRKNDSTVYRPESDKKTKIIPLSQKGHSFAQKTRQKHFSSVEEDILNQSQAPLVVNRNMSQSSYILQPPTSSTAYK